MLTLELAFGNGLQNAKVKLKESQTQSRPKDRAKTDGAGGKNKIQLPIVDLASYYFNFRVKATNNLYIL